MSSTTNYAPPSRNPADSDTLTGLLNLVFTKFLQNTHDMLPAKVIAYNAETNTAQVQPLINVVTTDGQQIPRAQVASVPVYQASGGGFIIRFPIAPGDLGWIKANDRDISAFKQSNAAAPPNTTRLHDFADSIFIPHAAFDLVTIGGGDTDNLVIQNYAGTVKISLSADSISITAPTAVNITAPTVTVTAATQIILDTPLVTMTGIFNAENSGSESIAGTVNGSLTVTGDVTADGISLDGHVHSGVTTGSGDTGGPV